MNYPPREETIKILLNVARRSAEQSTSNHPGDIAAAMATTLESAGDIMLETWRL